MEIRPYAADHHDPTAKLWFESSAALRGDNGPSLSDMGSRLAAEIGGGWDVWLAWEDGELLGFLALALRESRLAQLFIAPGAQGRGVGAALFAHTKVQMPDGFMLWTHPGNTGGLRFYEREGCIPAGAFTDADGDERLVYSWRP